MAKMTSRFRIAAAIAGLVAAATLGTVAPTAGAAEWTGGPVDIRVELDLPSSGDGPAVLEVLGVIPGPDVELTSADLIDNPSDWCGTLWVDIDPDTSTVTVATGQIPEDDDGGPTGPVAPAPLAPAALDGELLPGNMWDDCDFETASVTITGVNFTSFTLVSDNLWKPDEEAPMVIDGPTLDGKVASVAWASTPVDPEAEVDAIWMIPGGTAVLAYTVAPPTTTTQAPTTTAAPTTAAPATTVPAPPAVAAEPVEAAPTYTG